MMKHMKKAISFLMAVCLLAGNSYVNTKANTSVTMTEWTQVSEQPSQPQKPLLPRGLSAYLENHAGRAASAADATTGESYIFFDPTEGSSVVVKEGTQISITESMEFLLTKIDAAENRVPFVAVIDSVASANASIARAEKVADDASGYRVKITAVSPGTTSIMAVITDIITDENGSPVQNEDGSFKRGSSQTFTCTVEVKMEIDRSDSHWKTVAGDKKVLVLNQAEEYQIKLKGVENKTVNSSLMQWNWPNDGVIFLDESNGKITPRGAGVAEVSLKPTTGNQKAESFTIIVSPTGTNEFGVGFDKYKSQVEFATSSESFTLYTNGNPALNMQWEVYAITYNGTEPKNTKLAQTGKLLNYSISEIDGLLQFTGVKAGTYKVIGYSSKDKLYEDQDWNKVVFDITVNMTLQDTVKYLNVGDTFSILGNSNLPEDRFSELLAVDYKNPADGAFVADLDAKSGLLTANNNGTVDIIVAYRPSPADSIYPPSDKYHNRKLSATYTFHVIDEITLNTSSLTMYTQSTYQLIANATDRTAPITWFSSDSKLVSVDENGLLTAHKATGTKPVKIIASQVIDGVTKSVVCNVYVQPAVTEVALTPNNVVLKIGEYETIKAAVKPSDVVGTSLHWLVSDTSVFEITDSSDLTVTILGKTGGTAVLTALNAENIVVGYCKVTVNQEAQGIKLSQTNIVVPLYHKTYQLYATLTPDNTTNKDIIWASQNTKLATIDQNGLITFKKAGTLTVSAQSKDNPSLIAYCTLTIEQSVTSVELDYHDVELYTGEIFRLSYMVYPSTASHPKVVFSSFDTSIVAVDDTGMLTAKGPGKTQIMVMSEEVGSCYDICTVEVKQKATGVKMNYKELSMNRGEYFDMEVTVTPVNSTEASLTWESLKPQVATVSSNGRITARSAGEAIITVRTESGVTSYCTVTVLEPVISLELDPEEIFMDVGEIFQIDPVFTPTEPTNKEVRWSSNHPDIASVNALGEVEGISRGTAIITCETVDGGYRQSCQVNVIDPDMVVTITPDNYRLGFGKSLKLEVSVTNHGKVLDNVPIIWSSSDESICTVDEYGKITGVGYGDVQIRAEVDDDYGAYATCAVRVVREVTAIRLNHNVLTIIQGNTASLKADVQPANATYNEATFSSDDESVAVVDEDGLITALTPGTTWIWAKAKDNSGKYARCWVTVIEPVPVTGITVSDKKVVLISGETKKLTYTAKPAKHTDDLMWTSSNEAIATVNADGVITAHRTGTSTVTVMSTSGKTAQVEVTVIGLNRTSVEMALYDNRVTLYVEGATTGIKWDVVNSSIVEVKNGKLTSRKVGTTKVIATVDGRRLECTVTVLPNKKK